MSQVVININFSLETFTTVFHTEKTIHGNNILAVPEVTEKRFKGEMRMAFLEHSIQSGGIQRTIQTT